MDVATPAIYAYVLQACRRGIIVDLLSTTPRPRSSVLSPERTDRRRPTPLPRGAVSGSRPTVVSVSPDTGGLPSLCAGTSKLPIKDATAQAVLLGTELWLSVDVNDALREARRVLALDGLLAVLVGNTSSPTSRRHEASLKSESTWWEPDVDEVGAILKQHFPYVVELTINEVVGCTLHDVREDERTELLVSFPQRSGLEKAATHLLFVATRRPRKLPNGLNLVVRSDGGRPTVDIGKCIDMLCIPEGSSSAGARVSAVDERALERLYQEVKLLENSQQELEQTLRESRASLLGQTDQLSSIESARASLESELFSTTGELERAFKSLDELRTELEHEADLRESAERGGTELEASLTIAERRAIQAEVRCRRLHRQNLDLQDALKKSSGREQQVDLELHRVMPLAERERGRATRAEASVERLEQSLRRERKQRGVVETELLRVQEALSLARQQSEGERTGLSRIEGALEAEAAKRRDAEIKIAELLEALAVTRSTAERSTDELNKAARVNDDLVEEVAALTIELDQARDQNAAAARGLQDLLGANHHITGRGGNAALQDVIVALSNNRHLRSSMLRLMAIARDEYARKDQA